MMKLYYAPGACSLASHLALIEAGLAFTIDKADIRNKKTSTGEDFFALTGGKGYVPALQLDDGTVLCEGVAILQYVADQAPATGLAPANGTLARYQLQEWLNYIATEVHKNYGPLFNPAATPEMKEGAKANLAKRFDWLSEKLTGRDFLMGSQFTVADAYLAVVLGWTRVVGIDLAGTHPVLGAYQTRVMSRPAALAAMKAEGLLG
jgi:glutathione S-transferase